MIRRIGSAITAIIIGAVLFLPNNNVGATNISCDHPEDNGVIWYMGGSVTKIGELNPGQSYEGEIEACNADTITRKIKLESAPYSINQNDYDNVDFLTKNDWNRLADWISFPDGDMYTIGSGKTIFLKFRVEVPNDGTAIAGTQSASIMLTDVFRDDNSENVGLQTEKRYLWQVTADVDGANLRREGKITSWKADGPLVFDNRNGINTRSIVENTGNVSFVVKYKVAVMDAFRNDAIAYTKESEKEVLPESKRANDFKWNETPAVGWFKIREEITVFDKTETFEKMVLVVPFWFVIIAVAIIVLLVWALVLKVKQHRNKSKRLKS